MKYLPAAVTGADVQLAKEPAFGGEYAVYITAKQATLLGTILFSAANAATFTAVNGVSLSAPADLAINALTPILSSSNLVVQITGQNTVPTAMVGTVTFAPPSWADNQTPNFGRGFAFDVVPATNGQQYNSLTGLVGVTGGRANIKLGVYQLPEQADYVLLGCTTDIDFNTKSRLPKGVDCRMEADAFVKAGKSQPGELKIDSKLFNLGDGMPRFDGLKTTVMLVGVKDGQLTGERLVFCGWHGTIKPRLPDGDGEAMVPTEGKFEDHAFFIAP